MGLIGLVYIVPLAGLMDKVPIFYIASLVGLVSKMGLITSKLYFYVVMDQYTNNWLTMLLLISIMF